MNYKLPKELKKRMEREIKQYEQNKIKIEKLKQKGSTRQLLYLEERIKYVETVYNQLKPDEQEIFQLIFKNGCTWLYCKTIYNIDKNSYYTVLNKSLYFLAQEWGEI